MAEKKIRVLVVDDSPAMRAILNEAINQQADLEVVGLASHPLEAREMIKRSAPDVLTLDVEMPEMDGLTFLEKLMKLRPMPVLMVSSLTERGSESTLRALELGAVDFIPKPANLNHPDRFQLFSEELAYKIRLASHARIRPVLLESKQTALPLLGKRFSKQSPIFVGASTGGTEAIKALLAGLPADCPALMIAQHMPAAFTRSFAARLNALVALKVKEAEQGEPVLPGHVYVAPGHSHLMIEHKGGRLTVRLDESDPVNHHRPSVDVLFRSAAEVVGKNAIGILLTGMGKDGALGLQDMRQSGAHTIAQDEASCVVYGMPRAAVELGVVDVVLSLNRMADHLISRLQGLPAGLPGHPKPTHQHQ